MYDVKKIVPIYLQAQEKTYKSALQNSENRCDAYHKMEKEFFLNLI